MLGWDRGNREGGSVITGWWGVQQRGRGTQEEAFVTSTDGKGDGGIVLRGRGVQAGKMETLAGPGFPCLEFEGVPVFLGC